MDLERVTQVEHEGRVYVFYIDRRPPLAFWRVETAGRESYLSPIRVTGTETPDSLRRLAAFIHSTDPR